MKLSVVAFIVHLTSLLEVSNINPFQANTDPEYRLDDEVTTNDPLR
jgi:hypothetical protein